MSALRITSSQQKFLDSKEAAVIKKELQRMQSDAAYNTLSRFSTATVEDLTFVERHIKYLSDHPKVNPDHYLGNLRLMTRIKK